MIEIHEYYLNDRREYLKYWIEKNEGEFIKETYDFIKNPNSSEHVTKYYNALIEDLKDKIKKHDDEIVELSKKITKEEKINFIKDYYSKTNVSDEDLEKIVSVLTKKKSEFDPEEKITISGKEVRAQAIRNTCHKLLKDKEVETEIEKRVKHNEEYQSLRVTRHRKFKNCNYEILERDYHQLIEYFREELKLKAELKGIYEKINTQYDEKLRAINTRENDLLNNFEDFKTKKIDFEVKRATMTPEEKDKNEQILNQMEFSIKKDLRLLLADKIHLDARIKNEREKIIGQDENLRIRVNNLKLKIVSVVRKEYNLYNYYEKQRSYLIDKKIKLNDKVKIRVSRNQGLKKIVAQNKLFENNKPLRNVTVAKTNNYKNLLERSR